MRSTSRIRRGKGRAILKLEGLDSRRMPAALTATLSDTGVLHIEGTEARDHIVVRVQGEHLTVGRTLIQVSGVNQSSIPVSDVTAVEVNGLGGNDVINLRSIRVAANVHAGDGNDLIIGGFGADQLFGDGGSDSVSGRGGADDLSGGVGDDSLFGGADEDSLVGEAGDDRLHGGDGNDYLAGDDGDDRLNGNSGDDRIEGNDGDDNVSGGRGDDSIFGGVGDDRCSGDSGDDNLFGESGDDSLSGGSDDDFLSGDDGDDRLNGNGGADDCQGGLGDDNIRGDDSGGIHAAAEVEGTISAIDLAASTVTIQTQSGASVVIAVTASTIIERNGQHTTLDTFQVGEPGEAKFDAQGNTLKIEAGVDDLGGGGDHQDRIEGTITAIDLNTSKVTVITRSGTTIELSVTAATKIERNDQHATLLAFKVGDACEARFNSEGQLLKIEAVGL